MGSDYGDLLIASEAARILGVSPQRVRQMANDGSLPAIWVAGMRMFKQEDVEMLKLERQANPSLVRARRLAHED